MFSARKLAPRQSDSFLNRRPSRSLAATGSLRRSGPDNSWLSEILRFIPVMTTSCRTLWACVVSFLCLLAIKGTPVQAASAVASGIDSQGHVTWGWAAGTDLENTKSRALEYCRQSGAYRPKIILFTPKRGYGAIVIYKEAGNAVNLTASI